MLTTHKLKIIVNVNSSKLSPRYGALHPTFVAALVQMASGNPEGNDDTHNNYHKHRADGRQVYSHLIDCRCITA